MKIDKSGGARYALGMNKDRRQQRGRMRDRRQDGHRPGWEERRQDGPGPGWEERRKMRRSLSHVGGPGTYRGEARLRHLLTEAATQITEDEERAMTHGFHPWPGRMHPGSVRRIIDAAPEGRIADPFMGAGTVVLEALRAHRPAWGNELNPIGYEVAWVRTQRFSRGALGALVSRAKAVTRVAEARLVALGRREIPDTRFRLGAAQWFDDVAADEIWALSVSLREGDPSWQGSPEDPLTRVLKMVLSSIVVKASYQVSDSIVKRDRRHQERTPRGRVFHWFRQRARELAGQLGELSNDVPRAVPEPELTLGDAREPQLERELSAIITSPPYPGVYDYTAHHALRAMVLGIPTAESDALEIGSRRASERLGRQEANERYVSDLAKVLSRWSSLLVPGGFVLLVIGDGQVDRDIVRVMPLLKDAAFRAKLKICGTFSQGRPAFGPLTPAARQKEKYEHFVWLEPEEA